MEDNGKRLRTSMIFSTVLHMIFLIIITIQIATSAMVLKSKPMEVSLAYAEQLQNLKEARQKEKERQMANEKLAEERRLTEEKARQEAQESKKRAVIEEAKKKWQDKFKEAESPSPTKSYNLPSIGPETAEKEQQISGEDGNKTGMERRGAVESRGVKKSEGVASSSLSKGEGDINELMDEIAEKGKVTGNAGRKPFSKAISNDSAKFRSYSRKFVSFGIEKRFNFLIDFSFSSNKARERFFRKYDISVVPMDKIVDLKTDDEEKNIYYDGYRNPELYAVCENYISRYGTIPYCYIDNLFDYIFSYITAEAITNSVVKGIIEQYDVPSKEEIHKQFRSHKVVIVVGIDEGDMDFKLLEFGLYPLSSSN